MKKFVFLLTIVLALTAGSKVMAQLTDQDNVIFNAHLLEVLDITVTAGGTQEITFGTAASYNTGVYEGAGIVPGTSTVTVNSTVNWNMTILCLDFSPLAGAPGSIPIDNLGVWCESTGTFGFGAQNVCTNTSIATTLGLDPLEQPLISNGTGNAGDATENTFLFHWRMGTRDNATMNPATMFDQLQSNVFGIGDYTTTAVLTVDEI